MDWVDRIKQTDFCKIINLFNNTAFKKQSYTQERQRCWGTTEYSVIYTHKEKSVEKYLLQCIVTFVRPGINPYEDPWVLPLTNDPTVGTPLVDPLWKFDIYNNIAQTITMYKMRN